MAAGGTPSMVAGGAPSMSAGGAPVSPAGVPRLFYLDIGGGRVLSAKTDGSDVRVLVRGATGLPDGVAVDVAGGHVFWTNMGAPNANDGFVDRVDLDGKGLTAPVTAGKTFTPKQLKLDAANGKLYWADREGMRVQRANLDGTMLETLVESGSGDAARQDAANWCVGIALDVAGKKIYWTQKGGDNAGVGSIRRAGIDVPPGEDPAHRTDVEVLFEHLPEPIDLDVDLTSRLMYWTDRGNPPKGNTVSRAPMDPPSGGAASRMDQQILVSGLAEGIGIALDPPHDAMYFTDLGGTVYATKLDGSGEKKVLTGQGSLTGIAYVEL
jgi:DNA-binding beta-propeller fold protein YncE